MTKEEEDKQLGHVASDRTFVEWLNRSMISLNAGANRSDVVMHLSFRHGPDVHRHEPGDTFSARRCGERPGVGAISLVMVDQLTHRHSPFSTIALDASQNSGKDDVVAIFLNDVLVNSGGIGGLFGVLKHHSDHSKRSILGSMHHVTFKRIFLAEQLVLTRGVEVNIDKFIGLSSEGGLSTRSGFVAAGHGPVVGGGAKGHVCERHLRLGSGRFRGVLNVGGEVDGRLLFSFLACGEVLLDVAPAGGVVWKSHVITEVSLGALDGAAGGVDLDFLVRPHGEGDGQEE